MPKSTLQAKMNSSTAAAADNEKRDDQDPDPVGVVVEYAAKTVVVHKISSLRYCLCKVENAVLTIIICRCCRDVNAFCRNVAGRRDAIFAFGKETLRRLQAIRCRELSSKTSAWQNTSRKKIKIPFCFPKSFGRRMPLPVRTVPNLQMGSLSLFLEGFCRAFCLKNSPPEARVLPHAPARQIKI